MQLYRITFKTTVATNNLEQFQLNLLKKAIATHPDQQWLIVDRFITCDQLDGKYPDEEHYSILKDIAEASPGYFEFCGFDRFEFDTSKAEIDSSKLVYLNK